ncbi:MAG: undecaprenyl-diphosphate phosphatase [Actinobacteria bacterium]|nr:MAG: undecaprenyl-diphosphate phosphatase [Actinomycetota bacterium]
MTWFEAVFLGILQGLTEFLPISSSAHLLIFSQIFGWQDPGAAFTAVTQIGTETAVLIYFRKDIWRIITTWVKSLYTPELRGNLDARMGWYVIVGTIPIAVIGVLFADQIETAARNLWLVSTVLIVFGIILGVADKVGAKTRGLETLSMRSGLVYGFGQALALIPGVSRSGATITTGLFMGFTREAATRYAFLLAIPAVLASGFFEATKIGDPGQANVAWPQVIVATLVAFVIGYAVISWLLKFVSTHSYMPFVIYRVALGSLVLGLLASGAIAAN